MRPPVALDGSGGGPVPPTNLDCSLIIYGGGISPTQLGNPAGIISIDIPDHLASHPLARDDESRR